MEKYRVTEKHPLYKEGLIIYEEEDYYVLRNYDNEYDYVNYIESSEIKPSLDKGWIEVIEEPKFTEYDMIEFAKVIEKVNNMPFKSRLSIKEWLKKWIENKKAANKTA